MRQNSVTVRELLDDNSDELSLIFLNGSSDLDRIITSSILHQPGLTLAGYGDDLPTDRVQIFGSPECKYLDNLPPAKRLQTLKIYFKHSIPCVIASGEDQITEMVREAAMEFSIPLISTPLSIPEITAALNGYLSNRLAPTEQIHGTLVDVYGTGLLFIGQAGIGKSEIALDLVERGHRLVADDIVILKRQSNDVIIGSGPEMLTHMIEIRGVGIINIREIFGVRAVRLQKRVETVVELKEWNESEDYERLGLEDRTCKYLEIGIPLIQLPIFPGKNITVITEAIALNFHLKVYGYHAAQDLSQKLLTNLEGKRKIREYLKEDIE